MMKEMITTVKENLPIMLICAALVMGVLILAEEVILVIKKRKDEKER